MKQDNTRWTREQLRNPHAVIDKERRVRKMFSDIAPTYDLLNHLLSLNLDRRWRRLAVQAAALQSGQAVLDICCGTGDMVFEFARQQPDLGEIVGLDYSENMLVIARKKAVNIAGKHNNTACSQRGRKNASRQNPPPDNITHFNNRPHIRWISSNAENIPLVDESFDCVSCAFGIRNLQDIQQGLGEIFRVLKPAGTLIILEFLRMDNRLMKWFCDCYFRLVLPLAGSIIAGDKQGAYQYLPNSIMSFQSAGQLQELIARAGFTDITLQKLSFGIAWLITAKKFDMHK